MGFPPDTGLSIIGQIALTLRHNDHPVGHVDHEIAGDVRQQLLVHQLVHAPPPLPHDLVEAAEGAGIRDISSVGHCHRGK